MKRVSYSAAVFMMALMVCAGAMAAEKTLKNDGWMEGDSQGYQGGFIAGESAAVVLEADALDYPIEIRTIDFFYDGTPSSTPSTVTLSIWENVADQLDPGVQVFTRDFTVNSVANGTTMSQIDLTADAIAIDSGQFRVGLSFDHAGLPCIARDDDGSLQPHKNLIHSSGTWMWADDVGLLGDFIIRAVVETTEPVADEGVEPPPENAETEAPEPAPDVTVDADIPPDSPGPDAVTDAPGPDAPQNCEFNSDCLNGWHCGDDHTCTRECVTNLDCTGGMTCDSLGQCVSGDSGGGGCSCTVAGRGRAGGDTGGDSGIPRGAPAILLVLSLALIRAPSVRRGS